MPVLRQGSSGPEVTRLQQKLDELGFSPGAFDGKFGTGTKAAVLAFQRCAGMLGDGVAGPRTLTALGLAEDDSLPSAIPGVTVAIVARIFPNTPRRNISTHLPHVLGGLKERQLVDKPMVIMALATIRAETEAFVPIDEGISRYNTSPVGHPFDLYDNRADLGNQGPPDGEVFRGRGFIQLTGRHNYERHGTALGLGTQLLDNPELANDPDIAAKLLASFLKNREREIKEALLDRNFKQARKLVNGGSHGLTRFTEAYRIGEGLIG
ncbi:MAG: peptidoglycan-binding protein [Gammaproteobacteria bacterium]|nr:peptidoglycan-binding protein [Gammaproteobacteria bacterium]